MKKKKDNKSRIQIVLGILIAIIGLALYETYYLSITLTIIGSIIFVFGAEKRE